MLEIKNISKKYKGFAIDDISFIVDKGEYVVLLGESGAGKSLILEMIAGLIIPDSGEIWMNNKNITNEKIQRRNIGLVFQDNTVFPHLTVKDNLAFPLVSRKEDKKTIESKVVKLAEKTGISHLMNRWPAKLSGGELQRVALARTISFEPDYLLLDEPLASLDVQLRDGMRSLLREINNEGITIIHVTHDFEEAIALADKVGIIHKGRIIQFGSPKEVFHKPKSKFIANFTGIKNFFNAEIISPNIILLEKKIEMKFANNESLGLGFAMFKSEDVVIALSKINSSLSNNFQGKVIDIIPSIRGMELIVDIGIKVSAIITQESFENLNIIKNTNVWIGIKALNINVRIINAEPNENYSTIY